MKNYTFIFIFFSLLIVSCDKEVMNKIIFIPDEQDPYLPAYTEWGYNSFGAKYGSDYFLVSMSEYIKPCRIWYGNHQFQFELRGTIDNGEEMRLLFAFPSEPVTEYKDLVKLPKEPIILSDSNGCKAWINYTQLQDLNGKLHFKRVQLLRIDGTMERAIISGTFELNFTKNGVNETISNGRFDLGITNKEIFR